MPNFPLKIKPGIYADATEKDAEGRWSSGSRVRFDQKGFPRTIGGWLADTSNTFLGVARGSLDWTTLSSTTYIGLGTSRKLYLWEGGVYHNITPYRLSTSSPILTTPIYNPFSTTAGSNLITVTHTAHGIEVAGTTVTFSGAAASPIDGITVSGDYDVVEVIDANSFTIQHATTATNTEANFGSTDLVTNGVFAADTNWTKGTGWTIAAGVASSDGTQVADSDLTQTISITAGSKYQTIFTVTAYTAGNVTMVIGDTEGTDRATASTFTQVITAGAGSDIDIRADLDFIGSIDNVKVYTPVLFNYEIDAGYTDSSTLVGFGTGPWDDGTFGTPRTTSNLVQSATTWSLVKWGEDLIANRRGGAIYAWDASVGTGTRAQIITNAPSTAKFILLSPVARHLIAFGAHDGSNDDPLLIRWCSSEDYDDWDQASLQNTAGQLRVDQGTEIVGAVRTRGQILVFTDVSVHGMVYTGDNYVFAIDGLGEGCGLIAPHAAIEQNGVVYWFSDEDFFIYDGAIRTLPCDVRSLVFGDINRLQKIKIHGGTNRKHNEIVWFYCSADSDEIDRYVSYNYFLSETLGYGVWSVGELDRTTWLDIGENSGISQPYAPDASGVLYQHEVGINANNAHMEAYIQSHEFMLSEGEKMMHTKRLIPDFIDLDGSCDITLTCKKFPQSATSTTVTRNITSATTFTPFRARGRYVSIKAETTELNDSFHMGVQTVQAVPHGSM